MLLLRRYAGSGHMTQRLFEAVLAGCVPITPRLIRSAARFTPSALHVGDGGDILRACQWLRQIAGTREHAALIAGCLRRLDLLRLSRQLITIDRILHERVVQAT